MWVASVYATYQQGGSSIQVALHNMSSPEFAQSIFNFDLPVAREEISWDTTNPSLKVPNAVIDLGLPTAYAAKAYTDKYYIEVSIDDRSDAAKVYLKTFTLQILNRDKLVTANLGDAFKEVLLAARAAVSPVQGMEIGARAVQLQQMSGTKYTDAGNQPAETRPVHLTSGAVDGRYQTQVGEGGLLTSYVEMAGSHDSNGVRPDGLAGMGFLRLSSARLEGMVSGRLNTENWTPLGHTTPLAPDANGVVQRTWNDARMGTLRDQMQMNVTGYPTAWLPVTALFTRQRAWLPDGSEGTGVLQHAIGRVQLNKAGLPATTLQFGSTELDNPNAFQTHRLQGSAQTDYDLAPLLSFTRIKRFNVRALYSLSQSETGQNGAYAYGDRVRLMRLEGKLSPTVTESVNALFRSRDVGRQTDVDGAYWRSIYHWELLSGAQSTIIPGLVPKLNYNLFYDDCRLQGGCAGSGGPVTTTGVGTSNFWSNTGVAGSAVVAVGPPGAASLQGPSRAVNGSIGGSLGIYPGQWWPKLSPLGFQPSVAVGNSERTDVNVQQQRDRVVDFVGTEVWAGRKLEMMLYQRYRYTTSGQTGQENAAMTVLQNRIVYRPIFTSPFTLLINYEGDRILNDLGLDPTAQPWARTQTHQDMLEWLMRWNQVVTTRTRLKFGLEHTTGTFVMDPATQFPHDANHSKYSYGGELQVRLYPLADVSALYIYASAEWKQWDQRGDDPFSAWELIPSGGVIWRLGDRLYLDGHVYYDLTHCLSGPTCTTNYKVSPYVYFTMNL
jgi:hypothetical protein